MEPLACLRRRPGSSGVFSMAGSSPVCLLRSAVRTRMLGDALAIERSSAGERATFRAMLACATGIENNTADFGSVDVSWRSSPRKESEEMKAERLLRRRCLVLVSHRMECNNREQRRHRSLYSLYNDIYREITQQLSLMASQTCRSASTKRRLIV